MPASLRDIDFAPDDGFHTARFGLLVKRLGGKKVAVIGDGHGRHLATRGLVHHFFQVASSVQKTIVRVQMQVNESRDLHAESYSNRARRF